MKPTTSFSLLLTLTSLLSNPASASAIDPTLALNLPEGVTAQRVSPSDIPADIKNAVQGQSEHPSAPAASGLMKRNPHLRNPGVYMCTEQGFQGACWYVRTEHMRCLNFPGEWNDVFTSIGPDRDQECRIYVHGNCGAPNISVWHPGYDALNQRPSVRYEVDGRIYYTLDNMISSIQCSHYWQVLCENDGDCN